VINASSISSSASSSIVVLPATTLDNLPKTFSFVFSKPLSSFSFLSFEKKLNIPEIIYFYKQKKLLSKIERSF